MDPGTPRAGAPCASLPWSQTGSAAHPQVPPRAMWAPGEVSGALSLSTPVLLLQVSGLLELLSTEEALGVPCQPCYVSTWALSVGPGEYGAVCCSGTADVCDCQSQSPKQETFPCILGPSASQVHCLGWSLHILSSTSHAALGKALSVSGLGMIFPPPRPLRLALLFFTTAELAVWCGGGGDWSAGLWASTLL